MAEIGDLRQTHQSRRAFEGVQLPSNLDRCARVSDGLVEEYGQSIEARARFLEKEWE